MLERKQLSYCLVGENASLNNHRWTTFRKKVASATKFVHPQDLPPTSGAAKYHSQRVYLQVQQWKGKQLEPTDWGWVLGDEKLYPITTESPPAPQCILKVVKCSCSGTCSSMKCSSKKNGLDCTIACKNCKGVNCVNSTVTEDDSNEGCNVDEYLIYFFPS